MKFAIVSGNPKKDGLTRTMSGLVAAGARDTGAEVVEVDVSKLGNCRMCNGGQGPCLGGHTCVFGKDGFTDAQYAVREADALALVSPVYWEEVSEGMKTFLDRLRRCESSMPWAPREDAALAGKPVLLVASAGGSGMDMLGPLAQMERFCHHTGARTFDEIGVNRWNQAYKGRAVYEAARAMASGVQVGQTVPADLEAATR